MENKKPLAVDLEHAAKQVEQGLNEERQQFEKAPKRFEQGQAVEELDPDKADQDV